MYIGVKWEGGIPHDWARVIKENTGLEFVFDEEWKAFRCSPNFVSPGAALKYANRVRGALPKPMPSGEHALCVWLDGAKSPISVELAWVYLFEKKERCVEEDIEFGETPYRMAGSLG